MSICFIFFCTGRQFRLLFLLCRYGGIHRTAAASASTIHCFLSAGDFMYPYGGCESGSPAMIVSSVYRFFVRHGSEGDIRSILICDSRREYTVPILQMSHTNHLHFAYVQIYSPHALSRQTADYNLPHPHIYRLPKTP